MDNHNGNNGPTVPASVRVTKTTPDSVNRIVGVILLVIMIGVFWIYGFQSQMRNATTAKYPTTGLATNIKTQTLLGDLLILGLVFVVIGFGLLLSYYKRASFLAIFASIFTVSLTIIISPILQKFWFNVFITDFQGTAPTPSDPTRLLQYSLGGTAIYVDYYSLRISVANAIAQLVTLLALFGKMNTGQIIINCVGFNIFWTLTYFLCALLAKVSPDVRIYDDYQINCVYLFAGCYGLVAGQFLKRPEPSRTPEFASSGHSVVTSQLGTFFLFLSFCATTTLYTTKYTVGSQEFARLFIWQEAFLSTFIALSASVLATYAFSVLLNSNGIFGIRASLVGTIAGAVLYGPVAGTCINIGAAITSGILAGAVSALYFQKLYPRLNGGGVRDSLGGLGLLIVAFLGTFLIAPTVIKTYYNYSVNLSTLYPQEKVTSSYFISSVDVAGWALVYVGVSAAIAAISGLLIGYILRLIDRPNIRNYDDSQTFKAGVFGLREPLPMENGGAQGFISAQELNR